MRNRKNIGILCLMIATFLNPFGYAELFALVMKFTGDYWTTTYIFYALAVVFFSVAFYLLRINPIALIREKIKVLFKKS
jgi:arginine exporter protein ArgO